MGFEHCTLGKTDGELDLDLVGCSVQHSQDADSAMKADDRGAVRGEKENLLSEGVSKVLARW
jgi:hypothetical protein